MGRVLWVAHREGTPNETTRGKTADGEVARHTAAYVEAAHGEAACGETVDQGAARNRRFRAGWTSMLFALPLVCLSCNGQEQGSTDAVEITDMAEIADGADDSVSTQQDVESCTVGGTRTCQCDGGAPGVSTCLSDATWGDCVCAVCNDGQLDEGEECDGADLAGQSCSTLRFESGTLTCGDDCTFAVDYCVPPRTCDLLVQACPEGYGCYIVTRDSRIICVMAGERDVGDSCRYHEACRPGLACVENAGTGACAHMCGEGFSCPDGLTCRAIGALGQPDVGLCQ